MEMPGEHEREVDRQVLRRARPSDAFMAWSDVSSSIRIGSPSSRPMKVAESAWLIRPRVDNAGQNRRPSSIISRIVSPPSERPLPNSSSFRTVSSTSAFSTGGGTSIATGRPCFVIVIRSPRETRSRSWGR